MVTLACLALASQHVPTASQEVTGAREAAPDIDSRARDLFKRGCLSQAEALSREALSINPADDTAYRLLTVIYTKRHNYNSAWLEARRAVASAPAVASNHFNLATIQERLLMFDAARESYQAAAALGKNDLETRRGLAECQVQSGRWQEGIETLIKLAHEFPQKACVWLSLAQCYFSAGRLTEAEKAAAEASLLEPDNQLLLELAVRLSYRTNHTRRAVDLAAQLVEKHPLNKEGYRLLGSALRASGNCSRTGWLAERVLANYAGDIDLLLFLGEQLLALTPPTRTAGEQASRQEALTASCRLLRQACFIDPGSARANLDLAYALVKQEKEDKALYFVRRAYLAHRSNQAARKLYWRLEFKANDLAGQLKRWLHRNAGVLPSTQ